MIVKSDINCFEEKKAKRDQDGRERQGIIGTYHRREVLSVVVAAIFALVLVSESSTISDNLVWSSLMIHCRV